MLYAVVEEIWSLGGSDEEAKLLELLGPVDAKDGSESAGIRAKELASKFDHSGSEEGARYLYYWGRNDGAQQVHHFVIRPATLSYFEKPAQ